MRWVGLFALGFAGLSLGHAWAEDAPMVPVSAEPPGRTCEAISADLAAARKAGRLADAIKFYGEAGEPTAACAPKTLFCLGRSVALAHVEAAYAAANGGDAAGAGKLFTDGAKFGEPWLLLLGQGDAATARARSAHDAAAWAQASSAYQKAVSALDEPALCADEPDLPDAAAFETIARKMTLATLLAKPLTFFHTRCTPCGLAFLTAHMAAGQSRPVPITFEDKSAAITPEGLVTASALADCAKAEKWSSLSLSTHTDDRGSEGVNKALSDQRLKTLEQALRAAGFSGAFQGEAKGKSQPLAIDDPQELSAAEVERANRRVELRVLADPASLSCSRTNRPTP